MRHHLTRALLAVFAAWAVDAGTARGQTPLDSILIASGLNRPVYGTFAPNDPTRMYILEKRGVIRILDMQSGLLRPQPFLDIDPLVIGGTTTGDERGLLGMAFHPDFATNGYFYLNYTGNPGAGLTTIIVRYTISNPDMADPASAQLVMSYAQPAANHNGGWIGFGPLDGYLHITAGDGGGQCDPNQRAQDITNEPLGKILRVDVTGDDFPGDPNINYAVPPDNPFVGIEGDDEIWAFGLRNPFHASFDRATGDLYIGDVGQQAWEEIDYQPATSPGGENYGWDCREATHCSNCPEVGCDCATVVSVDPILEYGHALGCAVIGGYVYRGCAIPDLAGTYFYADYCSGNVWSFEVVGGVATNPMNRTSAIGPGNGIVSFVEDLNGELYIIRQGVAENVGQVWRIVPSGPGGDLDADGDVDGDDLTIFVAVLLGEDEDCVHRARADVNDSGYVNGGDVQQFLSVLF